VTYKIFVLNDMWTHVPSWPSWRSHHDATTTEPSQLYQSDKPCVVECIQPTSQPWQLHYFTRL